MQRIFQNSKKLIATCLVTVLLITSTLVSFPAPAQADTNIGINPKIQLCETECGNTAAFAAGVISGSAVTLAATADAGTLTAVGTAAATVGHAAAVGIGAGITAAGHAVAAPVVVPVAATAAVGYGAYRVWENHHNSPAQTSK